MSDFDFIRVTVRMDNPFSHDPSKSVLQFNLAMSREEFAAFGRHPGNAPSDLFPAALCEWSERKDRHVAWSRSLGDRIALALQEVCSK